VDAPQRVGAEALRCFSLVCSSGKAVAIAREVPPPMYPTLPRTPPPAMAAGIADHIWTCEEIAALLDSDRVRGSSVPVCLIPVLENGLPRAFPAYGQGEHVGPAVMACRVEIPVGAVRGRGVTVRVEDAVLAVERPRDYHGVFAGRNDHRVARVQPFVGIGVQSVSLWERGRNVAGLQ